MEVICVCVCLEKRERERVKAVCYVLSVSRFAMLIIRVMKKNLIGRVATPSSYSNFTKMHHAHHQLMSFH